MTTDRDPVRPIRMWYGDGPGAPLVRPEAVLEIVGLAPETPCQVTIGWMVTRQDWFENHSPTCDVRTTMAGYGLSASIRSGAVEALPLRISSVPSVIRADPPDIAVVSGIWSSGQLRFGSAVGWADVLAREAKAVVVEIDAMGVDLGAPEIVGNVVAQVERDGAPATVSSRQADEIDHRIGAHVAALLPSHPTVQFGPGGVGEAIASAVGEPLRVFTGLVTDAMASLHERGLLIEPIVAAYAWGGEPVSALAKAGMLRLASVTETHNLAKLAAISRFVACNTAVQIGLDGAVNVEQVGSRSIAGIGGHSDFCLGATHSVGGLSVIAARSTAPDGSSTVVPSLTTVSTPRSDVDVYVTEHGIADLRGASNAERSRRLIQIAAPERRDWLLTSGR